MDLNNKELLKQQLKNLNYDQLEKLLIKLTKYNLLLENKLIIKEEVK